MRRILAASFAIALLGSGPACAQAFDGDWEGVLQAGPQKLRLELHVKTEGETITAVLDSLDQGAKMPSSAAKIENGELGILFLSAGGELTGRLSPDGNTINGAWAQGLKIPLTLTRKTAK
jgi:uncharacterized protein